MLTVEKDLTATDLVEGKVYVEWSDGEPYGEPFVVSEVSEAGGVWVEALDEVNAGWLGVRSAAAAFREVDPNHCRDCGNVIEPHPTYRCDSCEMQASYDAISAPPKPLIADPGARYTLRATVGNAGWGVADPDGGDFLSDAYNSAEEALLMAAAELLRRRAPGAAGDSIAGGPARGGSSQAGKAGQDAGASRPSAGASELLAPGLSDTSAGASDGYSGVTVVVGNEHVRDPYGRPFWHTDTGDEAAPCDECGAQVGHKLGCIAEYVATLTLEQKDLLQDIDDAWTDATKGDIMVDPYVRDFHVDLARLVLAMGEEALREIREVDAEQHRWDGREISEAEAVEDVPRRVAEALTLLWWGGKVTT